MSQLGCRGIARRRSPPWQACAPGARRASAWRFRIQPQVTRIGRRLGNDIVIGDLRVSNQHTELRRTPAGRYSITDLGSHDGTYVNGTRVSQQELNEGDVIAIGHAAFRLADCELIEHVDDGAAGNPAVLAVLDRLGIRLEPEA